MKLTNIQNIGTAFKKENIFLATIKGLREKQKFLDSIIDYEEADLFYKDEKGYIRFGDEGPEIFVGDDSDGKGLIQNVIPVWDYYSEEELKEALANDTFTIIVVTTMEPLEKYNDDYNKWINKRKLL